MFAYLKKFFKSLHRKMGEFPAFAGGFVVVPSGMGAMFASTSILVSLGAFTGPFIPLTLSLGVLAAFAGGYIGLALAVTIREYANGRSIVEDDVTQEDDSEFVSDTKPKAFFEAVDPNNSIDNSDELAQEPEEGKHQTHGYIS